MVRLFKQYYPLRNILLIISEGISIYFAIIISYYLLLNSALISDDKSFIYKALIISFICQICLYYNELYEFQTIRNFIELGIRLFQTLGISAIIVAIIYIFCPMMVIKTKIFMLSIGFMMLFIVSWRILLALMIEKKLLTQKIILLGSNNLASGIIREIDKKKDCGYSVSLIIPENNEKISSINRTFPDIFVKSNFNGLCHRMFFLCLPFLNHQHSYIPHLTHKKFQGQIRTLF